jgi:fibronectin-binding autotransporter adhesin
MPRKSSIAGTRRNVQTSRRKRARVALASGAAVSSLLAICGDRVLGTVYTYTPVSAANDSWSTGNNWTSSAPVSATATELTFSSNATTFASTFVDTSTDDISTPSAFLLNILDLNGTAPASGAATINIAASSGNYLYFNGANNLVNLNANSTFSVGTLTGSLTYNVSAPISLGTTTTFQGSGSATFNFSGVISGSGTGITVNGGAIPVSTIPTTLTLSNTELYTGPTTINSAGITLSTSASSAASSAFTVNSQGELTVLNTTGSATGTLTPVVTRTSSLALNGGKLIVDGTSSGNTNDSFGGLLLGPGSGILGSATNNGTTGTGGNNVIVVAPSGASGTSKNVLVSFASMSYSPGGTVLFASAGASAIGTYSLASTTNTYEGASNIYFGTAPTLIGGQGSPNGGTITQSAGIIPNAISNGANQGFVNEFVTYDSTYGVRAISNYASTLVSNANVQLGSADANSYSGSVVINSLIINGSFVQSLAGVNLTVSAGVLLYTGGANPSTISGGTLRLGTGGDAFITLSQNRTQTIDSAITGPDSNHNLTISFGNSTGGPYPGNYPGTFILAGLNSYAGGTIINGDVTGDTVLLGGPSGTPGAAGSFGTGPVTITNAQVDLNHNNVFNVTNNFTGTGTVLIQQIGTTAAATLSGNIGGTIAVTQASSSAPLILSGTDSFTGNATITAGTLQISGTGVLGSGSYAGTISNAGTLEYSSSANQTFSGIVSGTGALAKDTSSTSVLTLTAVNTFTGTTTVSAGTLQIGGAGQLNSGTYAGSIVDNGTLEYSSSAAQTFSGVISGAGNLLKDTNTGALTLSGASSYTGNITISAGTVQIGGAGQLGSGTYAGSIVNNGTLLEYSSSAAQTFSGVISGAGSLLKDTSTSTLVLSATNTFTGNTTISAGTLRITGSGQLGSGNYAGSIADNGALEYSSSAAQTLSGVISGAGALLKDTNTGTLVLSGTNTYTGGTTISAGTVQISGSGQLGSGSYAGNITNAGTLEYSSSAAQTLSGAISGTGNLIKDTSTSILTLLASESYSGSTTVNAGTLLLNMSGSPTGILNSSSVLNLGGGKLSVTGKSTGTSNQTVASLSLAANSNSNIVLTPNGGSLTTLTITSTAITAGANAAVNFNYSAGTTNGGTLGNDYVVWNPALTSGIIGGGYTVTDVGGTGYATVNGSGDVIRLTDPGSAGLPASLAVSTNNYFINSSYGTTSTTAAGSLSLALTAGESANAVSVDTTGLTSGANLALGGNVLGLANGLGMTFSGPNPYTITATSGGGLQTSSAGTLVLNNYNSSTGGVTISAPILDNATSALTVNGTGSLFLTASNTYAGPTTINGGILNAGNLAAGSSSSAIGSAGTAAANLIINGGTLQYTGAVAASTNRLFTIGTAGATLDGSGTGSGGLSFTGPGNIAFSSSASPASLTLTGSATALTGQTASNLALNIVDSGTGANTTSLTKNGAGDWILSGVNTYTGGTTINNGGLLITAASALGGTAISVNGGALGLDGGSATNSYGSGQTLTLNGSGYNGSYGALSSVSNQTNIWQGNVIIGSGGTRIAAYAGTLVISGNISSINGSSTGLTIRNANSGSGNFNFSGSGTTTQLSGSDSYVGSTSILAGLLQLGGSNANPLPTGTQIIIGNGSYNLESGLDLNGVNQQVAGLALTGIQTGPNTVITNSSATAATLNVNTALGSPSSFAGIITGNLALTKTGGDVLNLTAANSNSYTGGTTVSAGTLLANSPDTVNGSTGSGLVTVAGGVLGGGIGTTAGVVKGGITVNSGAHLTAGAGLATGSVAAAPGILNANFGTTTLSTGSNLDIKVNNVTGAVGTNWDEVLLSALTVSSGVNLNLYGLTASNVIGATPNFNSTTPFTLPIADVSGVNPTTLTSEIPDFTINTSNFSTSNPSGAGFNFSLEAVADAGSGSFLELQYAATPEPATAVLVLGGAAPMLMARRRARAKSRSARG